MTTERKNFPQPLPIVVGLVLAVCAIPAFSAIPAPPLPPGSANDTTADSVLGQLDFVHTNKNLVDGSGFNMNDIVGDVAIDKSVSPNRVYATDRPNNRVLGWNDIAAFATHKAATIVIGQPDFSSNTPNNGGISARSLNVPTGVAVDSLGNLYIADASNHRVLFYTTPFTSDKVADDVFGQYGSFTTQNCDGFGLNEDALCTPVRVALDGNDNLYVTDQSNHRVLGFNTPHNITSVPGSGDETADRVFGQLDSFTVGSSNNGGISAKSLSFPLGVTVDSLGNLYVADFNNNRVLKYNTPLTTDTTADKVYGQLNVFTTGTANNLGISNRSLFNPMSVAVAPDGAVYISERSNHRILGYPPGSTLATTNANKVLGQNSFNVNICNNTNVGTLTPINSRGLCNPDGIALDTSVSPNSPNLYVSDTSNNRILQFKPSKTSAVNPTLILKTDQAAGGILGQSLFTTNFADSLDGRGFAFSGNSNSGSIAIDKSVVPNRIYVADTANNRVLGWSDIAAFTTHAPATLVFGQPNLFINTPNNGGISSTSLNTPRGIAVDSLGNLYVADQENHRILEYNTPFTSGTAADRVFGQAGVLTTNFCNPVGVNASSLCRPVGLALDSANNLYVADFSNQRVLVFNTPLTNQVADKVYGQAGSFITNTCNQGGVTANSFCNPSGVAVDSAGNVYVADLSNNRVLEFNKLPATDTTADKVFGQGDLFTTNSCNSPALTSNTLCAPRFVAVNTGGDVFVSDNSNNRVLKYNTPLTTDRVPDRVFGQGNIFTTNSCKTPSPSTICGPDNMTIDAANNLYVVDGGYNRVLRFLVP